MPGFLEGNYQLPKKKRGGSGRKAKADLTDQFEKQALAKLGGSLCFVSRKTKFIWTGEEKTPTAS